MKSVFKLFAKILTNNFYRRKQIGHNIYFLFIENIRFNYIGDAVSDSD